ncbi:MAG: DHH family phosphoesterase [Clostridiales bacterium]|nr:DHH family phosphoesterase [Clostridiales bacterium]
MRRKADSGLKSKLRSGHSDFSVGGPYLTLLLVFAAVSAVIAVSINEHSLLYLAGAEAGTAVICFFAVFLSVKLYRRRVLRMMDSISRYLSLSDNETLARYPIPVAIISLETEELQWCNDMFLDIVQGAEGLQERRITRLIQGFSTRWLLEGKSEAPGIVSVGDTKHMVFGCVMRSAAYGRIAATFWVDVTDYEETAREYQLSRPNVAILTLDNYSDLIANMSDTARSGVIAAIDEKVNSWAQGVDGLLFKTERERYIFIFEERWLSHFTQKKFSVLESVRQVVSPGGLPATLSIGVGHGGSSFSENYQLASQSLDMALSRGGDQAVVRDMSNFSFYGGRAKETEKQIRVKARVIATALGELISDASSVFVMGHVNEDIDSIGAAAGICCIARKWDTQAFIVIDRDRNDAKNLIARLEALDEYDGRFISAQDALMRADGKSLLVVVDTNRPAQVRSQELLLSFNRIVVIDHHRRAADYIERATLYFHEPFASSASELVVEIMQYLVSASDILKAEADALLGGMVLDTKSFSVRTGGRTFEAAAFIRRAGADTVEVKKLFQSNLADTVERYEIVRAARLYHGDIAISVLERQTDRSLAAQAADELLTISGISASFVLFPEADKVIISARSIGETNVQVILESLGGGGNTATAGAQLENVTVQQALAELVAAIDKYYEG